MKYPLSRRAFIQTSVLGAAGLWSGCQTASAPRKLSANDKLDIAVIGVANRGGENLKGVAHQNIVALCDTDDRYLADAQRRFPGAKTYNDFRRVLDQKGIDAVVVSTADHTHAIATVMALKSGRDVYCEKPLSHTISEARIVAETAQKHRRVTQMGTQIHAGSNYRRVVELIQTGAIGPVHEVHHWVSAVWSARPMQATPPPVPSYIHWDNWLGPIAFHPFDPIYIPANWRGWWDFGGGGLADMACHHMDLSFWALDLHYPTSVEAEGPPVKPDTAPEWLIVRYEFPERKKQPAVKLTWYNGDRRPHYFAEGKLPKWGNGSLFVGEKGMLLADYDRHLLLPQADFANFRPSAPFIPDSVGHHQEWIDACKSRGTTTCNFTYSGRLTESVLLGNVAFRTGRKLAWNPRRLKATNVPEAEQFIQHHYRKGWSL